MPHMSAPVIGKLGAKGYFMELKEFVKEALIQISEGVRDAQEPIREKGGYLNPAIRIGKSAETSHISSLSDGQNIYTVDFNIAISVTENTGTKADGKLTVASILNLGGSTTSSESNSTLSKIAFKVPLALPVDPVSSSNLKEQDEKDKQAHQQMMNKMQRGY